MDLRGIKRIVWERSEGGKRRMKFVDFLFNFLKYNCKRLSKTTKTIIFMCKCPRKQPYKYCVVPGKKQPSKATWPLQSGIDKSLGN